MNRDEFARQLSGLQIEVLYTIGSYRTYIALSSATAYQDVLTYHNDFFKPVAVALYYKWMIGLAKVFETGGKAMTLGNLLREAQACKLDQTMDLVPNASAGELENMRHNIAKHKPVLTKIKGIRNQQLAHLDAQIEPLPGPTKGEVDELVATIEEVFNGLSVGHSKNVYSWSRQAERSAWQTEEVLRILQEDLRRRDAESRKALEDSRSD